MGRDECEACTWTVPGNFTAEIEKEPLNVDVFQLK